MHLTISRAAGVAALAVVLGVAATGTAFGTAKKPKPVTTYGVVSVDSTAPAGTDPKTAPFWLGTSISIPKARHAMQQGDAGVLGGELENPSCQGSFTHPSAPKGTLCIYPGLEDPDNTNDFADVTNVAKNGEGSYEALPFVIGNGKFGVRLAVEAAAAGRFRFTATWAYTPR
jgi:hypothetical protein